MVFIHRAQSCHDQASPHQVPVHGSLPGPYPNEGMPERYVSSGDIKDIGSEALLQAIDENLWAFQPVTP